MAIADAFGANPAAPGIGNSEIVVMLLSVARDLAVAQSLLARHVIESLGLHSTTTLNRVQETPGRAETQQSISQSVTTTLLAGRTWPTLTL